MDLRLMTTARMGACVMCFTQAVSINSRLVCHLVSLGLNLLSITAPLIMLDYISFTLDSSSKTLEG